MAELLAVIGAALLVVNTVLTWWTKRDTAKDVGDVKAAVQEIHVTMNSRLDALLEATRASSHAAGMAAGVAKAASDAAVTAAGVIEGVAQEKAAEAARHGGTS